MLFAALRQSACGTKQENIAVQKIIRY